MSESETTKSEHPSVGLLEATLKAYEWHMYSMAMQPPAYYMELMANIPKLTDKQRAKLRRERKIRRARGWRLMWMNVEDGWHKREDCDGW